MKSKNFLGGIEAIAPAVMARNSDDAFFQSELPKSSQRYFTFLTYSEAIAHCATLDDILGVLRNIDDTRADFKIRAYGNVLYTFCREGNNEDAIDYLDNIKALEGPDFLSKVLLNSSCLGFRAAVAYEHIDVVKKILNIAGEVGGNGLVASLLRSANSESYRAFELHSGDSVYKKLLSSAHDVGGESLQIEQMRSNGWNGLLRSILFGKAAITKTILEAADKTGGQSLLKEALEHALVPGFKRASSQIQIHNTLEIAALVHQYGLDAEMVGLLEPKLSKLVKVICRSGNGEALKALHSMCAAAGKDQVLYDCLTADQYKLIKLGCERGGNTLIDAFIEVTADLEHKLAKPEKAAIRKVFPTRTELAEAFAGRCREKDVAGMRGMTNLARYIGGKTAVKDMLTCNRQHTLEALYSPDISNRFPLLSDEEDDTPKIRVRNSIFLTPDFMKKAGAGNNPIEAYYEICREFDPKHAQTMFRGDAWVNVFTSPTVDLFHCFMEVVRRVDPEEKLLSDILSKKHELIFDSCVDAKSPKFIEALMEVLEKPPHDQLLPDFIKCLHNSILACLNHEVYRQMINQGNLVEAARVILKHPDSIPIIDDHASGLTLDFMFAKPLSQKDEHTGISLFEYACASGNVDAVTEMLGGLKKRGNEAVRAGLTKDHAQAFWQAAINRQTEVVKLLLQQSHSLKDGDKTTRDILFSYQGTPLIGLSVQGKYLNDSQPVQDVIFNELRKEVYSGALLDHLHQTNYLLLGTLCGGNQIGFLSHILNIFPAEERELALSMLPEEWRAVVSAPSKDKERVWQELGGGNERWQSITNQNAPHASLNRQSPYKFKPKLYAELLPVMETIAKIERNLDYPLQAYKLAVLFSNKEEVDRYLTKCIGKEAQERIYSEWPIREATRFLIPEKGMWDVNQWKNFALTFGKDAADYISIAPTVEEFLKSKGLAFPSSLAKMREVAVSLRAEMEATHPEFAKAVAPYDLKNVTAIKAMLIQDDGLKSYDFLPNVIIDGKLLGLDNYYFEKLKSGNPLGLVLGGLTRDCQQVGAHHGHDAAMHGSLSPYGSFYVWKRKTDGNMTPSDEVVAQSWAWIAEDGSVVFDSFEPKHSIHEKLAKPFLETYAAWVVNNDKCNIPMPSMGVGVEKVNVPYVLIGGGGRTPETVKYTPGADAIPVDHFGFRETRDTRRFNGDIFYDGQHVINPQSHMLEQHEVTQHTDILNQKTVEAAEVAARSYIKRTLERFKKEYGIEVKTGMEIEFYAIGKNGKPTSDVLKVEEIQSKFKDSPLVINFDRENENPEDKDHGQYEISIGYGHPKASASAGYPLRNANGLKALRKLLKDKVTEYGLSDLNFNAVPYDNREPSSMHISVSLWSAEGKPLFADEHGYETPFLKRIVQGMAEAQPALMPFFAQTADSYKRYGHSLSAPHSIFVSYHRDEASLRIASEKGDQAHKAGASTIRIENRLPSSDASEVIAMAGTIAAIDYALKKYVKVASANNPESQTMDSLTTRNIKSGDHVLNIDLRDIDAYRKIKLSLPRNSTEALDHLKSAAAKQPELIGVNLSHIILQHTSNEVDAPARRGVTQ